MVPKGEVYSRSERSGYVGRDGRTARRKSWWAPECCVLDDTWVEKEKISRKKTEKGLQWTQGTALVGGFWALMRR